MTLEILPGRFAVCRLDPGASLPDWCEAGGPLTSVTHTDRELSIIAPDEQVPPDVTAERDYAALRVTGTLDFNLVGLLARLAGALAEAGVPLLAVSTYDTDVLLVKADRLEQAKAALEATGCTIC